MIDELTMLSELGESRRPAADEPPVGLRERALAGALSTRRRRRGFGLRGFGLRGLGLRGLAPVWRVSAGGAATAAVVVVTALLVGQAPQTSGTAPPAVPAAPPVPRGEQFVFTESVQMHLKAVTEKTADGKVESVFRLTEPVLHQAWRSADGTRQGTGRFRPYDDPDAEWTIGIAAPACGNRAPDPPRKPTEAEGCLAEPGSLTGLPTDTEQMLAYLRAYVSPYPGVAADPDTRAFGYVGRVAAASAHTPAVQAAVFRAAARIPGAEVVDEAVDLVGRRSVGVARSDDSRTEYIFDPATHAYLGVNITIVKPGVVVNDETNTRTPIGRPGDVLERMAILRVAVVDEPGQLP